RRQGVGAAQGGGDRGYGWRPLQGYGRARSPPDDQDHQYRGALVARRARALALTPPALGCESPRSRSGGGIAPRRSSLRWRISASRGLENLEQRVEIGDILAASRRSAADKVKDPAVLQTVVGETLHSPILVEIHGYDALIDHPLRHEADRPLGAL